MNTTTRLAVSIALNVAAVLPLASRMRLDAAGFVLALALFFAVFGFVLSAIEATVFSNGPGPIRGTDWIGGIGIAIVTACLAAWAAQATPSVELADLLAGWVREVGAKRRLLSIAYAATSFMVIYCVIGSAVWPLVRGYYEGPDALMDLRVPSGRVIIPLQLGRGILATGCLVPIVAALVDREALATWPVFALALAVTSSVVPLLNAEDWPLRLRVIHCIEIAVFSLVQGFAWWWFLCR